MSIKVFEKILLVQLIQPDRIEDREQYRERLIDEIMAGTKCLFPSRPDFGIKKANWRLKVSSDIRRETNKN